MASLQQLLAEEGFEGGRALKTRSKVEFRARESQDESVVLPIYICHDRKSSDFSKQRSKGSSLYSSSSRRRRRSLESGISNPWSNAETVAGRDNEPAIDEVAIRAMVSILSGYVGKYLRDQSFREAIKGKCYACFMRNKTESDNPIFANLEMAIESVESLAARPNGTKKELEVKSLQNSISLLTIVASLNSESSRNGSTCGIPNSHLSACAQLYLSIIYKLQKNNRISARHLLQVFCDSPFLARTCLLPELWEHLFLPHLLHLKIWHTKEHEFLSSSGYASRFSYATRRRKSSDSFTSHSSLQCHILERQGAGFGLSGLLPNNPLATWCWAWPFRPRPNKLYAKLLTGNCNKLEDIKLFSAPSERVRPWILITQMEVSAIHGILQKLMEMALSIAITLK